MKNLMITKSLPAKLLSTMLTLGLLVSSLVFNANFGAETSALNGNWTDQGNYTLNNWYIGHENDTVYSISSSEELAGLASLVNAGNDFSGKTINLTGNIYLAAHYWVPIGYIESRPFKGNFNGQNHAILNMRIGTSAQQAATNYRYCGLFGRVKEGTIKNVTLKGCSSIFATATEGVGGIVGSAEENAKIDSCINYCSVIARDTSLAGIAGNINSSSVINCSNFGTINGSSNNPSAFTAGIVGSAEPSSRIINCGNYGGVFANGREIKVAGIVAYLSGTTVNNCINFGIITGDGINFFDGAIAGWADGGDLSDNYYLEGTARRAVGHGHTRLPYQILAATIDNIQGPILTLLNDYVAETRGLKSWDIDANSNLPILVHAN